MTRDSPRCPWIWFLTRAAFSLPSLSNRTRGLCDQSPTIPAPSLFDPRRSRESVENQSLPRSEGSNLLRAKPSDCARATLDTEPDTQRIDAIAAARPDAFIVTPESRTEIDGAAQGDRASENVSHSDGVGQDLSVGDGRRWVSCS